LDTLTALRYLVAAPSFPLLLVGRPDQLLASLAAVLEYL
jgi:hypothetical protein